MSRITQQASTEQGQEQEIQPCHHMETRLSCLCDDTLSGPARWYTRFHILHCSKCRAVLKALRALRVALSDLGNRERSLGVAALTHERRTVLEQAMDEVDQREI